MRWTRLFASTLTGIIFLTSGCWAAERLNRTPDPEFGVEPVDDLKTVKSIWLSGGKRGPIDVLRNRRAKSVRLSPDTEAYV